MDRMINRSWKLKKYFIHEHRLTWDFIDDHADVDDGINEHSKTNDNIYELLKQRMKQVNLRKL